MIRITKAGYLYLNNVKISQKKINPFYKAEEINLTESEREQIRNYIKRNFKMV